MRSIIKDKVPKMKRSTVVRISLKMKTPECWRLLPRRALLVSILAQKMSKDVKTPWRHMKSTMRVLNNRQTDRRMDRHTGPILYPRPLTREGMNQRCLGHTKSMTSGFDPVPPFDMTFHNWESLNFLNGPLVSLIPLSDVDWLTVIPLLMECCPELSIDFHRTLDTMSLWLIILTFWPHSGHERSSSCHYMKLTQCYHDNNTTGNYLESLSCHIVCILYIC